MTHVYLFCCACTRTSVFISCFLVCVHVLIRIVFNVAHVLVMSSVVHVHVHDCILRFVAVLVILPHVLQFLFVVKMSMSCKEFENKSTTVRSKLSACCPETFQCEILL